MAMKDRSLGVPSSNCCSVPNSTRNEPKFNGFELRLERDHESSKSVASAVHYNKHIDERNSIFMTWEGSSLITHCSFDMRIKQRSKYSGWKTRMTQIAPAQVSFLTKIAARQLLL